MNMKSKHDRTFLLTAVFLISLSVSLLLLHYCIFRDVRTVLFYLIFNLAFIPIEVLFVTLVIDRTMAQREKDHMMNKLNMLVGLFYSELGNALLQTFAKTDPTVVGIKEQLHTDGHWKHDQFACAARLLGNYDYKVNIGSVDLSQLKSVVDNSKELLVSLLSNPSLLENESFSDLLLSIFHLQEEFAMRPIHSQHELMDKADLDHIKIDMERAYGHLARGWVGYMKHLRTDYPYLYVTACKKNPFLV